MSHRRTNTVDEMTVDRPLYPADRAFIIEVQRDTVVTRDECVGRVEHITSGRVARFGDIATLLRFLAEANGEEDWSRGPPAQQREELSAPLEAPITGARNSLDEEIL